MMKNKLTSLILAMSMTAAATGTLASISANAIFDRGNQNSPEYLEKTFNGNALDEKYYCIYDSVWSSTYFDEVLGYYISPKGTEVVAVHPLENLLVCKSTLNTNETLPELNAYINDTNKKLKEHFGENIYIRDFGNVLHVYNRGDYPVKEIVSFLKDYDAFYDFEYQTDRVYFSHIRMPYVTNYADILTVGENTKKVIDYVRENIPEAELIFFSSNNEPAKTEDGARSVTIKLKDNDSLTAHLDLALEIYEATGVSPCQLMLTSGGDEACTSIDVENFVNGDANCDDQITIADATAVLQALGNPDKYALSPQGEYNADVYGNGDGITPMDAITIQQYNAKIIEAF